MTDKKKTFDVDIFLGDVNPIIGALELLDRAVLPHTAKAMANATEMVRNTWSDVAKRTFHHSTGSYLNSLQIDPYFDEPYTGRVFSTHPAASYLEDGTDPYDMTQMLFTSHKARQSSDGKRYLIIPFRHGTPGSSTFRSVMPKSVMKHASQLSKSKITGNYYEKNINFAGTEGTANLSGNRVATFTHGKNASVKRQTYSWGGRLGGEDIPDRFQGLVRMDTSTENKESSSYMTFRVMSEKHPEKWQNPGIKALHIAKTASLEARPKVYVLLKQAVGQDILEIKEAMKNAN